MQLKSKILSRKWDSLFTMFHLGWLSEDVTVTDDLNTDLITDLSCNITMEENTFQKQRKQFFYELFR